MYPENNQQTLYDNVTPVTVASSTDATPIVVSATSHGFATGDRVLVYGHTTNIAANGIRKVTVVNANSFSLQDEITGANIAGSGGGAGSGGIAVKAPPVMLVSDFRNTIFQIGTSGTATVTFKVLGSLGKSEASSTGPRYDYPDFGATQSPSNPYSFIQLIDLDIVGSSGALSGSTGVVVAGTDINKTYEANINSLKYITIIPVSWTAGAFTIKALAVTNNA